ncbi:MAG: PfkB family carbohydrate kinase [Clostridia bacterium]|nr:PfkB family carbohydrate kinase [Clostridia bacterium]
MKNVNPCGLKRAALINDLSCFGKCSLSVAMPVLSSYGVETVPLPTAILSTHTGGFEGFVVKDMTDEMRSFSEHWKQCGVAFDAISTGWCCSVGQVCLAEDFIKSFRNEGTVVLVDPVLGDNGKLYACFGDAQVAAMRELCALADWITPNRTEAALLTGLPVTASDEELLTALPGKNAVITSIERNGEIGYLARIGNETVSVMRPMADLSLHGAGDVFGSAFLGELLSGKDGKTALESAAEFCDRSIRETAVRQPGHWYGLAFEAVLKERSTNG